MSDDLPPLPTVARLYYTGLGARRYKRASTMSGPGEPLCFVSVATEHLRRQAAIHAATLAAQAAEMTHDHQLELAQAQQERDSLAVRVKERTTELDRLRGEVQALRADAERWKALYRRALNAANDLTNYVEDRPDLSRIERELVAIEAAARAALKEQAPNVRANRPAAPADGPG